MIDLLAPAYHSTDKGDRLGVVLQFFGLGQDRVDIGDGIVLKERHDDNGESVAVVGLVFNKDKLFYMLDMTFAGLNFGGTIIEILKFLKYYCIAFFHKRTCK